MEDLQDRYEGDDDFDGKFEVESEAVRNQVVTTRQDLNGDGRPDFVSHLSNGVLSTVDIYDEDGKRIVARQSYADGWNHFTEFDDDGDGTFERRVEFDRYGEPKK